MTTDQTQPDLTDAQKAYNVAQSQMFQLAAYGHHRYHPSGEALTDEGKRQQRDYNDRIRAAREQLEAALLRLVAEHAETFRGDWGVPAAWLRSLADDPAWLSLLAVRPDERDFDTEPAVSSVGQAPATNQTALRERIAEAALRAVETAMDDTLLPAAREKALAGIAAALPAPVDRAAVLREAADECDRAGGEYAARALNDHAAGAFTLMETFLRWANEAEYVATPCSVGGCEPGGEPCSTHERLMAHAEGDHELCEPDCGPAAAGRVADDTQPETGLTPVGGVKGNPFGYHPEDDEARHSCRNCEGIDPDTCLMNPDRPAVGGAQQQETRQHVGGNAEDCPACEGTNPPYPFICPGPPAATSQSGMQTAACDAVKYRVHHNPHSWEPKPDADLVRCPGFTDGPQ